MGCASSAAAGGHHVSKPAKAPAFPQPAPATPSLEQVLSSLDDDAVKSKLNRQGPIQDFYKLGALLGKGGFATVRLGEHRVTQERFAIKIMGVVREHEAARANDSTWADVIAEVAVLCRLQHPNIIELHEFFVHGHRVYLVTSLVQGGELLDAVLKRGSYSQDTVRQCFRQLIEGIAYCHAHGVVHRDIKLENLLLERAEDITQIRIVDFGLAKGHASTAAMRMHTTCGTPHYVAPEVIAGSTGAAYGPEVDLWSAGVILYILLSGNPPFFHADDKQLYKLICRGAFSFQDPVWDLIGDEPKDIIRGLLVVRPGARMTAAEVLAHPWFARAPEEAAVELAGALDNLKEFRGHFRNAANIVRGARRLSSAAEAVKAGHRSSGECFLADADSIMRCVDAAKRSGSVVNDASSYISRGRATRSTDSAPPVPGHATESLVEAVDVACD